MNVHEMFKSVYVRKRSKKDNVRERHIVYIYHIQLKLLKNYYLKSTTLLLIIFNLKKRLIQKDPIVIVVDILFYFVKIHTLCLLIKLFIVF